MQVPEREKEDRRDWIIVLLILLFGFLCILLASGWALRLTPSWRLDSDMESNLDPNGDFLTNKPVDFYEPLDPSILTQPVWADVFLTPGAVLPTKPILPTGVPVTTTSQVLPTQTVVIAITPTNTGLPPTIPPTNTLIYIPPPPTNTPKPPPTKTAIPSADLAITKDDGNSSYIAGNTLTYTITITNIGPGNASGFNITDTVPAAITGVSAICSSAGTAGCGSNNTTGNAVLFSGASINAGAGNSITITVNGTVALGTTGSLSNTADIVIPAGAPFTDPDTASNNSATDTDTLTTASADLSITKTDTGTTYTPGAAITYTIEVTNGGPDNASGFNITDTVPAAITGVSVSCSSAGTAGCGANNTTGNAVLFSGASINAGAGNSITITVNGTVALGTTGSLSNTADIVIPAGAPFTDPDTASNNSATDTDTLATSGIDLSITKTDGINAYSPGDTLTYTIVVTNPSTSGATATGFNITDTIPLIRNTIVISCNPSSASDSCGTYVPPPPGGTNIAYNGAALSTGQTLTITVQGRVSLWQTGPLSNTANIVIPGGAPFTDPDTGNNTANDTDSASLPTCDSIIDVSGTGNIAITSGFVTCLRFTDPTLTGGATISITNTGFSYLRWNGLDAGGSGTCGIYTGLLWPVGNSLNNIYVDRNGDIILYAQALLGNDTLNISAIADWNTGCP